MFIPAGLAITHFSIFSPAEPGHEGKEGGNHEEHEANLQAETRKSTYDAPQVRRSTFDFFYSCSNMSEPQEYFISFSDIS